MKAILIKIEDSLHSELKIQAVKESSTLQKLIAKSIKNYLESSKLKKRQARLI